MTASHDAAQDTDDAVRRVALTADPLTRLELGDRVADHLDGLSPA